MDEIAERRFFSKCCLGGSFDPEWVEISTVPTKPSQANGQSMFEMFKSCMDRSETQYACFKLECNFFRCGSGSGVGAYLPQKAESRIKERKPRENLCFVLLNILTP